MSIRRASKVKRGGGGGAARQVSDGRGEGTPSVRNRPRCDMAFSTLSAGAWRQRVETKPSAAMSLVKVLALSRGRRREMSVGSLEKVFLFFVVHGPFYASPLTCTIFRVRFAPAVQSCPS